LSDLKLSKVSQACTGVAQHEAPGLIQDTESRIADAIANLAQCITEVDKALKFAAAAVTVIASPAKISTSPVSPGEQ
jgi:hypothetical protein